VPRFDADTWAALEAFAAAGTATMYTSKDVNDPNAYTGRYRSEQFLAFLIAIKPQQTNPWTYGEIYRGFTALEKDLNYHRIYSMLRRSGRGKNI
jgi:hypothetical protein